jgi:acyl-CoA synthetase (AMP-forming)/AMP-acid ligase II
MSIISSLINGTLAIDPQAPALEFEKNWYSWGDLRRTIDAVEACLQTAGIGPEARIGVMVRNRPSSLAAVLGVVARNSCMVSINPLLPKERLNADLSGLHLPVVIGEASDLAREGALDVLRAAGTAVIELEENLQRAHLLPGFEKPTGSALQYEQPGVIIQMLTSGTTGIPKRVPLMRAAFEKSFVSALSYEKDRKADDAPVLRDEVVILSNPLTHIGGLWAALTCVAGGRKGCLLEKFSVETWHDAIVRHRPKVAGAVPTGLRMILDANIPKEDLASLVAIRTGAAPLDPSITEEFFERYQIPVLQNYGATEFSGAVAGWTLRDFYKFHRTKPGSVGRFQPGVVGRVVDQEAGVEKPHGEEGVLEMKSAQFANGGKWLRTTDRAIIDADGFLFIMGRADSAIIRGGFKVHPDDVAAVLEKHPAIREAVVVGIEDRRLGAVPVAAIMLKAGVTAPSDAELSAFAKEKLLPYQVPVRYLIVDDVPRTPSLKPMLPQVRELFIQKVS